MSCFLLLDKYSFKIKNFFINNLFININFKYQNYFNPKINPNNTIIMNKATIVIVDIMKFLFLIYFLKILELRIRV